MSSSSSVASGSKLPSIDEIDAELAVRHLSHFVAQAWIVVEPETPLIWNWHLDLICDALERQAHGDPEYRKLVLCVPPGTMKSLTVSVFGPAWEWLHEPSRRKMFLSNDDDLASRDSRRMREIILSDWYQRLVVMVAKRKGEQPWVLAKDQAEKLNFANSQSGVRQSRSMGSKLTGKRANDIVIDDPLDAREVINGSVEQIAKRLLNVNNIIEKVLPSRVNNLAEARWTIIMQRLHDADPAGRALREGGWQVINLQMEYDPNNPLNHPEDPRTEQGELLFHDLFPLREVEKLKVKLGNDYYAQYQQDPRPGDRAVLKRHYWCFWYPSDCRQPPPPVITKKPNGDLHTCRQQELPRHLLSHTQSWDMTFKDTKDSAYVVGQVWAQLGADSFLLDQERAKLDIVGTVGAVARMSTKWPQTLKKLVEDKANGPAVISMLRSRIPGLTEVNPEGGKEARMNAAAPVCKSSNVWLPHPAIFPWVEGFIAECEAAPFGEYMDQVDAATQYLIDRYGQGANILSMLTNL